HCLSKQHSDNTPENYFTHRPSQFRNSNMTSFPPSSTFPYHDNPQPHYALRSVSCDCRPYASFLSSPPTPNTPTHAHLPPFSEFQDLCASQHSHVKNSGSSDQNSRYSSNYTFSTSIEAQCSSRSISKFSPSTTYSVFRNLSEEFALPAG